MKIGVVLEQKVTEGGGFNQGLNAILQINRLVRDKFEFVVYTKFEDNIQYLSNLGILARLLPKPKVEKLSFKKRIRLKIINRLRLHQIEPANNDFEQFLLSENIDLVYFVMSSGYSCTLSKLNYMITVWDLCHRDSPEFPEVRLHNDFATRENINKNYLGPATIVLTDSEMLSQKIIERYGIDNERLLAMPFAPAPFIVEHHSSSKQAVLAKYGLDEGYYFYPAQFWSHKNHVRIIEALKILHQQSKGRQVVFAGDDKGNRGHVERVVVSLGLAHLVKFLGFVPVEDMRGLYEGAAAVVMPTYFGPTNIPPLEAWFIGIPLIYSIHFVEQAGEAALLVDPDNEHSLAEAMLTVLDPTISADLVRRGYLRLDDIAKQREKAEAKLLMLLCKFEIRRKCWA